VAGLVESMNFLSVLLIGRRQAWTLQTSPTSEPAMHLLRSAKWGRAVQSEVQSGRRLDPTSDASLCGLGGF
jgi:hypothetical protein